MDAKERGNDQEVRRRRKEQRLRPSSKASREAAASRTTSDGSQPPFGTVNGGNTVSGNHEVWWILSETDWLYEALTNPSILSFATRNHEDFSCCPGNWYCTAHDPRMGTSFCTHGEEWRRGKSLRL